MKGLKKLLTCLTAGFLLASLALPASAATNSMTQQSAFGGLGSVGVEAVRGNAKKVNKLSVSIVWEAMNFTYRGGDKENWNPANHTYGTTTDGYWSDNKPAIRVDNHSNAQISVSFSFAPSSADITAVGTFYTKSGEIYTPMQASRQQLILATAEGTAVATPPTGTVYLGMSGGGIAKNQTVGSVTIAVKPDYSVFSAKNLYDFINIAAPGDTLTLMQDITVSDAEAAYLNWSGVGNTSSNSYVTLDLNGFTLTGAITMKQCRVLIKNGTLNGSVYAQDLNNKFSDVVLLNLTVDSGDESLALYCLNSAIEVNNCTLNGSTAKTATGVASALPEGARFSAFAQHTSGSLGALILFGGTTTVEYGIAYTRSGGIHLNAGTYTMGQSKTPYTLEGKDGIIFGSDGSVSGLPDRPDWIAYLS